MKYFSYENPFKESEFPPVCKVLKAITHNRKVAARRFWLFWSIAFVTTITVIAAGLYNFILVGY